MVRLWRAGGTPGTRQGTSGAVGERRRPPANNIRPMFWLRLLYLANGLSIGALFGFAPVLLVSKGFDPELIGFTIGLGSLGYTLALPAWGHLGDIVSGSRRALQMAVIPAAIFALGLSAPLPTAAIIVCMVVVSAGGGPTMALTDAMTVPALEDASREYSGLRLTASIGAAGGAVVCGFIYSYTGYLAAPVLFAATMALALVSAQMVPLGRESDRSRKAQAVAAGREQDAGESSPGHRFGSAGEALSGRPRLVAVLVSILLVHLGVAAAAMFISLRISDLGGGPIEVGLSNGLGSGAEVPGLILAGWLAGRFGLRFVLLASAVGFSACVGSWVFIEDTGLILLTRFISGIFFGGVIVAFVLAMSRLLPFRLQATGQTLFQATAWGVAAVLAGFAGGFLYQNTGPAGIFGGGAVCGLVGAMVGFLALSGAFETAAVEEPTVAPAFGLAEGFDVLQAAPLSVDSPGPGTMPAAARWRRIHAALGRSIRRRQ
jgi:PPP family 3-phenylpropionic acid transporter